MARFFLTRWFRQSLKDLEPGDAVRVVGYRGVAFVESTAEDHALIVYGRDRRSIVPLVSLRRVRACGAELDRRG